MSDNNQIGDYKLDTALYGSPHPSFDYQDGDLVISARLSDHWTYQSFRVHQAKLASSGKGLYAALLGGQETNERNISDNVVVKVEEHEDEEDEPLSISTLDLSDKHGTDKVKTIRCAEDAAAVVVVLLAFVYDDEALLKLDDPEHSFKVWKAALKFNMHALALYAESAMLRDKERITATTAIEIIAHASKYNMPDVKKAVMPLTVRTHLLQLLTTSSRDALCLLSTEDVLELTHLHMHAAKYYPAYQNYKGIRDASLDKQVAGPLCRHPAQNGFGNPGGGWPDNSCVTGGHDATW